MVLLFENRYKSHPSEYHENSLEKKRVSTNSKKLVIVDLPGKNPWRVGDIKRLISDEIELQINFSKFQENPIRAKMVIRNEHFYE